MPLQIPLNFANDFRPLARNTDSHKAQFGRVGILGGDTGFSGAIILAGQAALRTGAGLVTLLSRLSHAAVLNLAQPELMVAAIETTQEFKEFLPKIDVLAIGPGMGQSAWAENLFLESLHCSLPMILDADALNLLAKYPHRRDDWILTPHPGEAARLLNTNSQNIQDNRESSVRNLQEKFGGIVVLKGHETLICDESQQIWICTDGNPWMATPGMGDALTGIITGFVAQKLTLLKATQMAVLLHAHTADVAHHKNHGIVLATDVIDQLQLT